MTDSVQLMEFLYSCIPFAELDYDYLVVVCRNEKGKVMPSGLRFSNDFFVKLKTTVDTEDVAGQLSPPFPEEVTAKILNCFEDKYEIFSPVVTGYEGIDRIAELLWAFSKSHKELSDDSNTEYRNHIESYYKTEIENYLKLIENRISQTEFNEISQLCSKVFIKYDFDDTSFNIFFSNLIIKSQELMKHVW
jgi:hypothetical protein